MKIVVASSDQVSVDQHFGNCEIFSIYRIENDGHTLLKQVSVTPYSTGEQDHQFDQDRFADICYALQGCQRIYCSKIGEKPKEALSKNGIDPFEYSGRIDSITL